MPLLGWIESRAVRPCEGSQMSSEFDSCAWQAADPNGRLCLACFQILERSTAASRSSSCRPAPKFKTDASPTRYDLPVRVCTKAKQAPCQEHPTLTSSISAQSQLWPRPGPSRRTPVSSRTTIVRAIRVEASTATRRRVAPIDRPTVALEFAISCIANPPRRIPRLAPADTQNAGVRIVVRVVIGVRVSPPRRHWRSRTSCHSRSAGGGESRLALRLQDRLRHDHHGDQCALVVVGRDVYFDHHRPAAFVDLLRFCAQPPFGDRRDEVRLEFDGGEDLAVAERRECRPRSDGVAEAGDRSTVREPAWMANLRPDVEQPDRTPGLGFDHAHAEVPREAVFEDRVLVLERFVDARRERPFDTTEVFARHAQPIGLTVPSIGTSRRNGPPEPIALRTADVISLPFSTRSDGTPNALASDMKSTDGSAMSMPGHLSNLTAFWFIPSNWDF